MGKGGERGRVWITALFYKITAYNRNLHNLYARLDNSIWKNKTRSIKRQQDQRYRYYNISTKRENLNIPFCFALVHIPRIKRTDTHQNEKQKHSQRTKKPTRISIAICGVQRLFSVRACKYSDYQCIRWNIIQKWLINWQLNCSWDLVWLLFCHSADTTILNRNENMSSSQQCHLGSLTNSGWAKSWMKSKAIVFLSVWLTLPRHLVFCNSFWFFF